MSEVSKIQADQRSLAIAQRVTSSALVDAKKHRAASPSLAGGKKRGGKRSASPAKKSGKKAGKKSGKKRSGSPKRK